MLNIRMQNPEVEKLSPKITVIGVGGAGGNAVNNMISSGLEGCEFLVANTDAQALESSLSENRLQLGASVTGGLGAGARPEVGRQAAEESLDDVMQILEGSNMVFVTAGMGGGTGTGAAPIIAKTCRDSGILTVGVVTKPFHFEGAHRMRQAEQGILEMQDYVDTLIVIPNQNLFRVANEKTTFAEAFRLADSVLQSGVRGVTDLMVMPGLINLDFADIRSAMLEMGKAMMGTGEAEGERRSIEAAEAAISNPLLDDVSMKGARGVIVNVTGGSDMTLFEVDDACNRIREEVDPNANIIFGSTFDENLEGRMRVSVVATGIDVEASQKPVRTTTGGLRTKPVTTTTSTAASSNPPAAPVQKAERAQPAATSAAWQTNVSVVQAATAAARSAIPAAPMQPQMMPREEPENELFEQQEFHQPAPQQQAGRGSTYHGQFIPPAPVVPERQDQPYSGYGMMPPTTMPSRAPEAQGESGYVLRPPVPGARTTEERKKTPSLFERITTGARRLGAHESVEETGQQSGGSSSAQSSGGFGAGGLRAQRQMTGTGGPAQGQLNIDAPAAQPRSEQNEDNLDIPAFLRRQAN